MDHKLLAYLQDEVLNWLSSAPPGDGVVDDKLNKVAISTATNGRAENQDRAIFVSFNSEVEARCFTLSAVLDGIGGLADGGRCAEMAIASIISHLISLPRREGCNVLVEALVLANDEVWRQYQGRGGTTFAGLLCENSRLTAVNVGDSRVYVFANECGLVRLSSDDKLRDQFARMKGLEDVVLDASIAERLGQYVGMQGSVKPNVKQFEQKLAAAFFLLTTDGAHAVGDEFMKKAVLDHHIPRGITEEIIAHTLNSADSDNATAVCGKLEVLRTKCKPLHLPFERLQISALHGIFNLLIPRAATQEPEQSQKPAKGRTRAKRSKPRITGSGAEKKVSERGKRHAAEPDVTTKLELSIQPLDLDIIAKDELAK